MTTIAWMYVVLNCWVLAAFLINWNAQRWWTYYSAYLAVVWAIAFLVLLL